MVKSKYIAILTGFLLSEAHLLGERSKRGWRKGKGGGRRKEKEKLHEERKLKRGMKKGGWSNGGLPCPQPWGYVY